MPIRTNRGRAAVYRKLWAWPLRSPKHLVIAAIGLVAVAMAVGLVLPQATKPLANGSANRPSVTLSGGVVVTVTTQPAGAQAPGAPSTSTSTSRVPRVTITSPPQAPPAPEALAVAEAWARAWVNHPEGMTSEEWVAQLVPLTTEEFLPQLRSIDPANIPSSAVTGKAEPVSSSARAVEVSIVTDGATLRLTVIATDAGWRVSAFNRTD
jgi:hypothetical protein